jgi:hypothetical protein
MKRSHVAVLEGHLSEERAKAFALCDHLVAMRFALKRMQDVANTLVHRWQVRDRRALDSRICAIVTEIERICNGFYITKLDDRASIYRFRRSVSMKSRIADRPENSPSLCEKGDSVIINEFLADVNSYAPPIVVDTKDDTCAMCDGGMRLVAAKSLMCCRVCGYSVAYLDSTLSALAYGDDANMSSTFSYKRINHFTEWITRIQAKTTYEVPQDVIDSIMAELAVSGVEVRDVTQARVLQVMKKLKHRSKLNEFISHITMRITGKHPPRLTDENEQLLKLCFAALQVCLMYMFVFRCR